MDIIFSKNQLEQITTHVKCGDARGTGFFVKNDVFLTARHNIIDAIEKRKSILIEDVLYKSSKIIAENSDVDICLIKVEEKERNCLPLYTTQFFFNQECSFFGFPNYSDKSGEHFLGRINTLPKNKHYDISVRITDFEDYNYEGMSGGPVICEGKLIGMTRLQMDNQIGVVSFAKARSFLESNNISIREDAKVKSLPDEVEETIASIGTNLVSSNRLEEVLNTKQNWLLCSGSPGSGKTTLAAKFMPSDKNLIVCGRYFIKIPNDKMPIEVRTSVRSLLSWLEISISKLLGENIDSLDNIEERIKRIQKLFYSLSISDLSKQFLFIIDGLDEVENLDSFLGILPLNIPKNIRILLFCTNKDILPSKIKGKLLNELETKLEPLGMDYCEIFIQNKLKIEGITNEIIQKLAIKSEGHPLYLNYLINSLNTLKIAPEEIEEWINKNPEIDGDIEKYYESIWDTFFRSPEKLLLISTISQFRSPIDESILVNCLPSENRLSFYSNISSVKYLTSDGKYFELYHRSFKNYISKKVPEIIPIINDNIFQYCNKIQDNKYSIENWLYHLQNGTNSIDSVSECNQKWADKLCLKHINPELIIEDIKKTVSKAVDFSLFPEVIRILLLLQRIEFRYDSLYADNSFDLCKSMIAMKEYSASLRYLVRDGDLLVSDNEALFFLQQYYENDAYVEGDKLLEVLESRFRLYVENEFKKSQNGFSLRPFSIIAQAHSLSIHSKGKEAIGNSLKINSDLKRFQDAAQMDGAQEASDTILETREICSAWLNGYALRCFDFYTSLEKITKITNANLDKLWTKTVALTILFHDDFDGYDTVHYDKTKNYYNYIKDIEWLFDNHGVEDDITAKGIVIRALIKSSKRTDIIDRLIDETIEKSSDDVKPLIKAANGVDLDFEKLGKDEFSSLCRGYKDAGSKVKELPDFSEISEDWEASLYKVFLEVNYFEGVLLRKIINNDDYSSDGSFERLKSIITTLTFSLRDRSNWNRSYLIPEDIIPIIFSKITSILLNSYKQHIEWYIDFIKERCQNQFGIYSEGYRSVLIKMIKEFILRCDEDSYTMLLIDMLSNFILKNVENRWERTPELLMANEFYNLIGKTSKADNIYLEIMKTSMGPSWYKEDQFSILNTAFSLSQEDSNITSQIKSIAYLLDEAAGEMTFQRYVRHSKESFIGLLANRNYNTKAIEYLKFETIPPPDILVKNAEFYEFDQIYKGFGYSYGANNISIEAGVLSLLENSKAEHPELISGLAYVFALHNEVFRYIASFGKLFGKSLNLIKEHQSQEVNFDWIIEIANSSKIKDEKRNFLKSISLEMTSELIIKFNEYVETKGIDIKLFTIEAQEKSEVESENTNPANSFEEFNQLAEKKMFESKSKLLKEGVHAFTKERISPWFQNWSHSSKITKGIIKENFEDTSDLLNAFKNELKNIEEEPWHVADSLIWFGDKVFNQKEVDSIQNNIFNHIQLLIHREKTVGDKYDWLSKEEVQQNSDTCLFKLLVWLINYPEKDIRRRSEIVVRHLIIMFPEKFLPFILEEATNHENIDLRVIVFNILLEFANQKPKIFNSVLVKPNNYFKQIIDNSDLISIKKLKDIGDILNKSGYSKLSEIIKKKFMVEIKETGDVYFEDDRFACVNYEIEQLIDSGLLNPDVCKALEVTQESYLSTERIEILKKANYYLRQSFRDSRHIDDNYKNAVKKCLNITIMTNITLENIDKAYKIINKE